MKISAATRSRARHYAMQALYQWQMTGNDMSTIEAEYHSDNDMSKVDVEYFHGLFHGAGKARSALDDAVAPHLKGMTVEGLDPVTLAILRLASYEFNDRLDVPYKVVINESVNLAKKFGSADSHKFVNGVLDKVAADLRPVEVKAAKNAPPKS